MFGLLFVENDFISRYFIGMYNVSESIRCVELVIGNFYCNQNFIKQNFFFYYKKSGYNFMF